MKKRYTLSFLVLSLGMMKEVVKSRTLTALLMVKPSKAFVPQAEDSARKIFQVESLFASLLSKRETDRILKFSFQCTVGKMT